MTLFFCSDGKMQALREWPVSELVVIGSSAIIYSILEFGSASNFKVQYKVFLEKDTPIMILYVSKL